MNDMFVQVFNLLFNSLDKIINYYLLIARVIALIFKKITKYIIVSFDDPGD